MEPSGKNTGLRLRSTEFLPQFYQGVALWLWHPVLPFGLNVHICNKDRIGPEDCYASSPRENGMRLSKARFSYLHQYTRSTEQKLISGFPGGAVVENLPANAGDMGSSPGLGRSHMLWSDKAREPQLLSLSVWSLCSATREAAMVRDPRTTMKSVPHLPQLEKALTQIGRAHV